MLLPTRRAAASLLRRRGSGAVVRTVCSSSTPAAPAAQTTSGSATPPTTRPGVLVVGGGRMGQIRAAAFFGSRKSSLAGIVEENPERARELASLYPTPVFPSLDSAIESCRGSGLKGVWLSTPTPSHVSDIERTAAAGLAIGVEKPVAERVADIERCYALADKAGVPLFCSFQRRTDPSYQKLLADVRAGEIGDVRSIGAVFRDHPVPPLEFLKLGGDIFHDLVVHDADFIMHLLDEVPERVYAKGSGFHPELRSIGVLDQATCVLEFGRSGVVASIELSRSSAYGYDQRIEVFGSDGMCQVANPPRTHVVVATSRGIAHDRNQHSFPQRFAEAYVLEAEAFSDVMVGSQQPGVTVRDCVNSTLVAEACRLSARKGQPVRLAEVGR